MNSTNQIVRDQDHKVKMLSSSWAAKASTKHEVYLLLVTQVKAYLPRSEHVTVCKSFLSLIILFSDFLRDIISGKKKYLKQDKVSHCYVPQYDGLGLREIYAHIDNDADLKDYFPDDFKERARLPKQWIVNLLSALTGGDFGEWVMTQINARNERVAIKADKFIEVDPDIAAAFNSATSVSLVKGSAHSMLQM